MPQRTHGDHEFAVAPIQREGRVEWPMLLAPLPAHHCWPPGSTVARAREQVALLDGPERPAGKPGGADAGEWGVVGARRADARMAEQSAMSSLQKVRSTETLEMATPRALPATAPKGGGRNHLHDGRPSAAGVGTVVEKPLSTGCPGVVGPVPQPVWMSCRGDTLTDSRGRSRAPAARSGTWRIAARASVSPIREPP